MPIEYEATLSSARSARPTLASEAAIRALGVASPRRGEQPEVLPAGEVAVEARLVDDRADPGQCVAALGRDRDAEQRHRATVGLGQPEQGADQRRLAGSVRPEVAERAAARDEQLDVVDRDVRRRTASSGRASRRPSRGRPPETPAGAAGARCWLGCLAWRGRSRGPRRRHPASSRRVIRALRGLGVAAFGCSRAAGWPPARVE